jgi:hypothetical protein
LKHFPAGTLSDMSRISLHQQPVLSAFKKMCCVMNQIKSNAYCLFI